MLYLNSIDNYRILLPSCLGLQNSALRDMYKHIFLSKEYQGILSECDKRRNGLKLNPEFKMDLENIFTKKSSRLNFFVLYNEITSPNVMHLEK